MQEKLHAITLSRIRYSDRHDIINFYTLERGRITFLHPTQSGRKRRVMPVMPLSLVEINANIHQNREIQQPGKISITTPALSDIYTNPLKNCMAIFMADFMNRLLREASPDQAMWEFLRESIIEFEYARSGLANFHIAFLTMLSRYAGIMPDLTNYTPGRCFDMAGGSFTTTSMSRHSSLLNEHDSAIVPMLLRMNYDNARAFRFNREERRRILDLIVKYYDIYFPGIGNLRSLEVLHDIFR